MINTEKRYCGLYSVEIKGLTCEQSELALRYLLDRKMNDHQKEQPIEFGCYRNEQTKELIFDSNCNVTDRITDWTVTVFMHDGSFRALAEIPWFAGKNITSMYLNFRERGKRFNQLIEDLLKAIDSE